MGGVLTKDNTAPITDVLRIEDIVIEDGAARTRKDAEFKELTESIKATGGILQPIIVRPYPKKKGKFQLLAGRRRLAATKAAGSDFIKAEIYDVDNRGAMLIMVTENLQRKDLTPLEEAANLGKLIKAGKDTKAIAADLGRNERWVVRRAKLIDLIPEWVKAAQDPESPFSKWSAGHLEAIARFDPEIQKSLFEKYSDMDYIGVDEWTVEGLDQDLANTMRLLRKAPWDLDDDSLNPKAGACTNCPRRSSHQPILFDDDLTEKTIKANDKCLDVSCWDKKAEAYLDRRIPDLKQKHANLILIASNYSYQGKHKGVHTLHEFVNVKRKEKGALPALVVDGPGTGELRWVRLASWVSGKKAARAQDARGKPKAASLEDRKKKFQHRRNAFIIVELRQKLDEPEKYPPKKILETDPLIGIAALAATFGTESKEEAFYSYRGLSSKKLWEMFECRLQNGDDDKAALINDLWRKIAPVLSSRLSSRTGEEATKRIPEAQLICDLLGLDFADLKKQSIEALPDPKSWAKPKAPAKRKVKKTAKKKQAKKPAKKKKKAKRGKPSKKA